MNARVDQLFAEAQLLTPEDRSVLAYALLDSVGAGDTVDELAIEQAWIAESVRRSEALKSGASQAQPWAEVKARLLAL
jgi:putative addiction module component (TIGR02574 family)